jgi:hypothetical protein
VRYPKVRSLLLNTIEAVTRSRVASLRLVSLRILVAITSSIILLPTAAAAGTPEQLDEGGGRGKTIGAIRTPRAPWCEGRLDDAVWQAAPSDDRFTQIQPAQGKAPSEHTSFKVMYDDTYLYVAVRCDDTEPENIVTRLTRRDRDIEADWVSVSIDSRNDHASASLFQLSAAGVQVDGQYFNDADFSTDWDAVWNGAVSRDATGWSAEFAIPLTVLRFSSDDVQSWGVQIHRNLSRKREQMMWSYRQGGRAFGVSRFGYITGLQGLHQKRTFELRPYVLGRFDSHIDEGRGFLGAGGGADNDATIEAGIDAKIGLTSRLTLDLTVNPDFGQVEADQVVLNLSRFETFFPEKRPFFLEGRDLFETPIQLFYPRRIGRPTLGLGRGDAFYPGRIDDGMYVPEIVRPDTSLRLWTATKVTGDASNHVSVAALGAITGSESVSVRNEDGTVESYDVAGERSYGVLRGRYALGEGDFLGVTGTAVNRLAGDTYRASADHDAYAQAVDFAWQEANWRTTGQFAVSEWAGGPKYRNRDSGGHCTEDEYLMNTRCVPIARANGSIMGPGTVGYGAQLHTAYQTTNNILRLDYTGHSPTFDVNDAGFSQTFDRHELKAVGGFADKEAGDYFLYQGVYPFALSAVGFDGSPQYSLIGVDLEAQFTNFVFTSPEQWILLPKHYDSFETFDGAHFEQPAAWEGHWEASTNPGKMFSVYGRYNWFLGFDGKTRSTSLFTQLNLQATSNVEISLEPEVGIDRSVRFYQCTVDGDTTGKSCLVDDARHEYIFGDLKSRFLSGTLRATMTILPELSIQGYAQWFMADGKWSNFKETHTTGDRPDIERNELSSATDFEYTGDDDFEQSSLNVNLVMRWEVRPGSTLFAVYTRNQGADYFSPKRLTEGPTEDLVLVKFQYFVR